MSVFVYACSAAWRTLVEKTNTGCSRPQGQTAWQHCFISTNAPTLSVSVWTAPTPSFFPSLSLVPSVSLSFHQYIPLGNGLLIKKWTWPQINPSAYLSDPCRGTSPPAATNIHVEILLTAADKPTCNIKASWCNPWSHCMCEGMLNGNSKLEIKNTHNLNRVLKLNISQGMKTCTIYFSCWFLDNCIVLSSIVHGNTISFPFYVTFQIN